MNEFSIEDEITPRRELRNTIKHLRNDSLILSDNKPGMIKYKFRNKKYN